MKIIQPLIGMTPVRPGNPTEPFTLGFGVLTDLNISTNGTVALHGIRWRSQRRFAQAGAAMMERHFCSFPQVPFLLDPTAPSYPFAIVFDDYVMVTVAAGVCNFAVGILDHLTPNLASSLVGVGFERTAAGEWALFVKDAPGLVPRYLYQIVLAGVLTAAPHRLTMLVDGRTHTVVFSVDAVEVGRYTPAVPLDRMGPATLTEVTGSAGAGPYLRYRSLVPALGDMTQYLHGGGQYGQVRAAVT